MPALGILLGYVTHAFTVVTSALRITAVAEEAAILLHLLVHMTFKYSCRKSDGAYCFSPLPLPIIWAKKAVWMGRAKEGGGRAVILCSL
jgi:hypothetical protein